MPAEKAFDLHRFLRAQDPVFETVLSELNDGNKRTHWMWFIFPQLRGLGRSSMAKFYGIASLEEARAYLEHPVLGERLVLCTRAILKHEDKPLGEILGFPDDLKFCSSMTLFANTASDGGVFDEAIIRFCDGRHDEQTIALLSKTLS
jgi:uncharacterized protein (DUF1810 family)